MAILGRTSEGRARETSRPRNGRALLSFALASIGVLMAAAPRAQQPAQGQASLSQTRFTAQGRNEAILTVSRFGRYSVSAKSKQGTALQIVDRMTGPGESEGFTGKADGRIDTFLDGGTYKVIAFSHEKGQGELNLSVKPFVELSGAQVPLLLVTHPVDGKLEDLQQISYWIQVKERRTVHVEAQGRDLNDMRLWLEGNWLVDAAPTDIEMSPVTGRPVADLTLVADLNPGYYLLTAYGGPPKAWAKETGEHPFHLRLEFPELPSSVRIEAKVSAFGVDRYLVPKPANFYLLQLPEKKDFVLETAPFDPGDGYPTPYDRTEINKKSQDPECDIEWTTPKSFGLVTVTGPPGEPYVLQAFERKESYQFKNGGRYWISTIHSGYVDDDIDATGILVSDRPQDPHAVPEAADVIHVGAGKTWARRFNLLGDETLYFFAEETGDYEIRASGAEAEFKFEPFMITPPKNYKSPSPKAGSCTWPLDKGYWVLSLSPTNKGILTIEVREKGGIVGAVTSALAPNAEIKPGPAKGSVQFPDVTLDPKNVYTLYVNRQEGVKHGVILRAYPMDLLQPLPVALQGGEEVTLSFTAAEDAQLSVSTVAKAAFSCWVDGASVQNLAKVAKGEHKVRLKNETSRSYVYTLLATPAKLLPENNPASLSSQVLETFSKFPVVTEKSPLFFDFGVTEKRTALLTVDAPALYRIETTGLLQTSCTVRTRTRTSLFSNEAGGVGRNCLVLQYLKDGDYQLTVQTTGKSAGHAGLTITRTQIEDGGALAPGKEARADVPSGAAVVYSFALPKAAKYRVQSFGQSKTFLCRLEDKDGWPLMEPNTRGDFQRDFAAGAYRVMTLPWDVDTLRSTRVDEVLPPRSVKGRGPHALQLNETLENTWEEPKEGAPRERDLYDVALPAEVDAAIALGNDQMQGFLKRKDGDKYEPVETVAPGGKGWSGVLPAGQYRLEVECSRQNDLLPYAVTFSVTQLVAGVSRDVSIPATLPVSVSSEGVVELYSSGRQDTRARLYADGGALVAENDDAYNDWNFRIARKLKPGRYSLLVEPVGAASGKTRVSMSAPAEVRKAPLSLPFDQPVELAGAIQVFPVPALPAGGILSVRASGTSFVGCILEKAGGGPEPKTLAQRTGRSCEIDVPVDASGTYQVRLWSADHLSETARLEVAIAQPQPATLAELESGKTVRAAGSGALSVSLPAPGTFRVKPAEGFTFSTRPDEALAAPDGDLVSLPAGTAFLKWAVAGQEARAQAERVVLKPGDAGVLKTDVAAGKPIWVDVAGDPQGFTLLTARGEPGRPGCVFPGPGEAGGSPVLGRSYALGEDACASVGAPGASLSAEVWNTQADGTSPVSLQVASFAKGSEPARAVSAGVTSLEVPPGGRALLALPAGPKRVDVDLEEGLVAFPYDGAAVAGVAWADSGPKRRSFSTGCAGLCVLNPGPKASMCSVAVLPGEQAPEITLKPGTLFEKVLPDTGSLRLRVADIPAGGRALLLVEGTGVSSEWMDGSGTIRSGSRFELTGREGVLAVDYGPGLVKAWIAEEGRELAARWGEAQEPAAAPAAPNAVLPLSGRIASFSLSLDKPSALHFASDGPCVAALRRGSGGDFLRVAEGSSACSFDEYLEPGAYVLSVRALAGGSLAGTARLSASEVLPIEGTFGPDCLLGGGESRTFAFTAPKKGHVGIGLRTTSEVLDCELLTRSEKLIGRGIQQFVELEPGTYLMRVSAAPGSDPVRFAPAVVGLKPPGEGPPDAYLQDFLQKIGMVTE